MYVCDCTGSINICPCLLKLHKLLNKIICLAFKIFTLENTNFNVNVDRILTKLYKSFMLKKTFYMLIDIMMKGPYLSQNYDRIIHIYFQTLCKLHIPDVSVSWVMIL